MQFNDSDDVTKEIEAFIAFGEIISDQSAGDIAMGWQSPGYAGDKMAEIASCLTGDRVPDISLWDTIDQITGIAKDRYGDGVPDLRERRRLAALAAWCCCLLMPTE